jgi:hypothetical protein
MFKRELSVNLAKPAKAQPAGTGPNKAAIEKHIKQIGVVLESSIVKIGIAVCAYVVLDTARQVLVAKASK